MKIKNILLIASIVIVTLGLSIIFIPTEIGMTLLGVILVAVAFALFFTYIVYKGPTK
ncbi:MAG: hypothetical protein YK1309IOTA_1730002 [Marine Group I thaumarchaeote]|nr:MAG: hypothetical protein YK1309IOTA_1730002 [Marine Group I thaumarchaeote]